MGKLLERIVDMPGGFLFLSSIIAFGIYTGMYLFANGLLFLENSIGIARHAQAPLTILIMLSGVAMGVRRMFADDDCGGYHKATTDAPPPIRKSKSGDESGAMLDYGDLFYTEYDPPQVMHNPSNERYWK